MNRIEINVLTGEESVIELTPEEIAQLEQQAAVPVIPREVPMWAAQAALKQAGKYDAVNAYLTGPDMQWSPAFFAWTMGNYASRSSAFIASLAGQFSMTDADIDAVFTAAAQIAAVAS